MSPTVVPASFRDPAGFVWTDDGAVYRHVGDEHREHYDRMMSSGLYEVLLTKGLLIPHVEVSDVASPRAGAYKILRPEVVAFISYPYEWSFSQLKDAALATLDIQRIAIEHGMSLRDASAYNIQFQRGRPVLIDTLSFEILPEGRPWIAYRQFCQHFLAPLALMSHLDVRCGGLLRLCMDGIPVDLAAKLLPRRTRLKAGMLAHMHLQARVEARHERAGSRPRTGRTLSVQQLRGVIWSLERAIRKLDWNPPKTAWRDYYEERSHYSDAAARRKEELVGELLDAAAGTTVWDLGGNVGLFSRLAAARGRDVVCFDVDPSCVEINYRKVVADTETRVLPLLCDLRNPAPAQGWAGRERFSLADRGPADVVLALALIHHLVIGNNVPLPMVAEYLSQLGERLIIEFVPKSDPMVQRLLASREDIFGGYDQDRFEEAFGARFTLERSERIDETDRVLYLMRKR